MKTLLPSSLCFGAACVATLKEASAQGAGSPKVADKVLAGEAPVPASVQRRISQAGHPELRVKVLLPKGGEVSPKTRSILLAGSNFEEQEGALDGRSIQVELPRLAGNDLNQLAGAAEVQQIEIVRPPHIDPIDPPLLTPLLPGAAPQPFNLDAARSHFVPEFSAAYPPAAGETLVAAVFDGGAIRHTHQEFRKGTGSRITLRTSLPTHYHATHVAGTIAAQGVPGHEEAKGMASKLSLLSYDWDDDLTNLAAVAPGICVSNHSYGPVSGWTRNRTTGAWYWWGDRGASLVEDSKFGKYASENHVLDQTLFANPSLLVVAAAGNDRDDAPAQQPVAHYAIVRGSNPLEWELSSEFRRPDGFDQGGLDTVCGLGISKNCLCIGAIFDVQPGSGNIETTGFSGWGPADDGRVKPDLVANGYGLLSTSDATDDAYLEISGTSMASPTASGISVLMVELYQRKFQRPPLSAEVKAILIHSATDGGKKGPDPIYGWGSINALKAGDLIASRNGASIRTGEASEGEALTIRCQPTEGPIRASLVWTDPAAPANGRGLDDAKETLQNNLNLRLIAPDETEYFPYSLNRADPLSPAGSSGPNSVDNVEVIDAQSMPGEWRVEISGASFRQGSKQKYALVLSGIKDAS